MTTPMPDPVNDWARKAWSILEPFYSGQPYDRAPDGLAESIAKALADAARVREGHVRDDKGVERKVLGTLPVTADGCVIGFGEQAIMYAGASARVYSNIGFGDEPRPNHWTQNWYSSKEAAAEAGGKDAR